MTLNEYQEQAMGTCLPSSRNFAYMFYNFLGEVGEMIEKANMILADFPLADIASRLSDYSTVAKTILKQPETELVQQMVQPIEELLPKIANNKDFQKELGDIEWQLNGMMTVLGLTAEEICQQNLDKLASRKERNKIDGDGDNR